MDFARCGCHPADIQEPVGGPHERATSNKCGQAGIKDSVGRAGGSDHMPQRFPLEISSILQVPDRGLEQAKASARGFFGFPIALQLIFALQAGPFIRIDGFNV